MKTDFTLRPACCINCIYCKKFPEAKKYFCEKLKQPIAKEIYKKQTFLFKEINNN